MLELALIACLATGQLFDDEDAPPPERPEDIGAAIARGAHAYRVHCATCHGIEGAGDGPTAKWISSRPRDLVTGQYRWRTTGSGELPTDADILRTIDEGAVGTAMPAWKSRLPLRMRKDLVHYIKTFCVRFQTKGAPEPMVIPDPPEMTPERIAIGKEVFRRAKCAECHGEDGRGGGPSAETLQDEHGRTIPAYDFTKGFYKGGRTPKAVYRTFMTGLNGTPMPSYADSVPEDERWPLVFYTISLGRERGIFDYLFGPLEEQ